jgi:hypothetical protein
MKKESRLFFEISQNKIVSSVPQEIERKKTRK